MLLNTPSECIIGFLSINTHMNDVTGVAFECVPCNGKLILILLGECRKTTSSDFSSAEHAIGELDGKQLPFLYTSDIAT